MRWSQPPGLRTGDALPPREGHLPIRRLTPPQQWGQLSRQAKQQRHSL